MSKQDDISQLIRKYLNGELDAPAMYQLEKEAQNDPFLMEALEGYEHSDAGQQQHLADVHARLHHRTQKAERRIIPWKWISIAASVLAILMIGGLWLRNTSPQVKTTLAKIAKPKQAPSITKPSAIDTVETINNQSVTTKQTARNKSPKIKATREIAAPNISADAAPPATDLALNKPNEYKKDTAKLGEVAVVGYGTQNRVAVAQSSQTISANELAKTKGFANNDLADISVSKEIGNTITGTVTEKDDGSPLPGVTVMIKGTAKGTQTDANGHFVLNGVPNGAVLKFAYVGYAALEIAAGNKKLLAVNLQPNTNSLSEVVVTNAYGVKHDTNDGEQPIYEGAHPANGWNDFKKYLKDNAESPDGKTGVVKVSLKVDGNGILSDFKIKRSLSTETDNAAIQLIQNGPRWISNSNHTSETVTVKVRFEQKK